MPYHTDVLVWVLVTRGVFEMAAAVLMLIEPMRCGGQNKVLHRLMASILAAHSLSAFNRAIARAVNPYPIPAASLMLTDTLLMVLCVVLAAYLGYELVRFRQYERISGLPPEPCTKPDCPYKTCT